MAKSREIREINRVKGWESLDSRARIVPGEPFLGYYEIEDKLVEIIKTLNEVIEEVNTRRDFRITDEEFRKEINKYKSPSEKIRNKNNATSSRQED